MMGYKELLKIYYKSIDDYQSTYQARVNSTDAIKLSFRINGNQAFFVRTAEIAEIIFQIQKVDKSISILCSKLPGVAIDQFKKRCLIDEIILTNKIEGVYSTRREIASILYALERTAKEKRKRVRFRGLVEQYLKLLSNERIVVETCEDVRMLYDELVLAEVVEEEPGNAPDGMLFRKDSTSVYSPTNKEIHRGSYPETVIYEDLNEALKFLNDDSVFILYRAAVFHYLFGYIHPFYDGNGRLGRFIVSAMLSRELHPLIAYRISYTIAENLREYYEAFEICNEPRNLGDVTPFVIMMLGVLKTSIVQLEEALSKRYIRFIYYTEGIVKLPGGDSSRTCSVYSLLIQAGLFSENGISTKALVFYMGNSYTTVKKELDFIENSQLLIKTRVGRDNLYMLDLDKLDVMWKNSESCAQTRIVGF